jgi:thiol-disulfide isomerase/thioredoxin/regulator of replication initiation timing
MRKKLRGFCSLFLGCLLPGITGAQPVHISLNFPAYRDSQLIVGSYYFGSLYAKDTLRLDQQGTATFTQNERLAEGIYQLYFNANKHYDFLVGNDQQFSIALSPAENQPSISGADETRQFQQYINDLAVLKARFTALSEAQRRVKDQPDSLARIKAEIRQLGENKQQYQLEEGLKNRDNLYGKVLLATRREEIDPEQIPLPYRENDSLRWVYEYNFHKQHYWDYFDLGDPAMWHTPFVKDRLNNYFNKVLLQTPDSVLPEAINLIERYRNNPELFRNLTSYLANNSIRSKIMGMENVFVALAKRYYLSGQASWADEKTMKNIRYEVAMRQNNLLGNKAPELLLEDADGEFHSLYESPTPYTILVFWEPGCIHCQQEIPELYNALFLNARPSQLSVYAVYTMTDKKEWTQFITENELTGWQNLWDPQQISDMKTRYGLRTTPSFFLLGPDKKIIAKQLDIAGLRHFLKLKGVMK